jgi:hypothetical protein
MVMVKGFKPGFGLSALHVAESDALVILVQGNRYKLKMECTVPGLDLAVLSVQGLDRKLPQVDRASVLPAQGDKVTCIGFPAVVDFVHGKLAKFSSVHPGQCTYVFDTGRQVLTNTVVLEGQSGGGGFVKSGLFGIVTGNVGDSAAYGRNGEFNSDGEFEEHASHADLKAIESLENELKTLKGEVGEAGETEESIGSTSSSDQTPSARTSVSSRVAKADSQHKGALGVFSVLTPELMDYFRSKNVLEPLPTTTTPAATTTTFPTTSNQFIMPAVYVSEATRRRQALSNLIYG